MRDAEKEKETLAYFKTLSDEERIEFVADLFELYHYCKYCGRFEGADWRLACRCWDDS